jgi:hypothetical protein
MDNMTQEQYDQMVDRIRSGRAQPLEESQARWDRMTEWSKTMSLSQMVDAERELNGSILSRERVRAIIGRARPGATERSKLVTYQARERKAMRTLTAWKGRTGIRAERLIAAAKADLAESRKLIRAEKRRRGLD